MFFSTKNNQVRAGAVHVLNPNDPDVQETAHMFARQTVLEFQQAQGGLAVPDDGGPRGEISATRGEISARARGPDLSVSLASSLLRSSRQSSLTVCFTPFHSLSFVCPFLFFHFPEISHFSHSVGFAGHFACAGRCVGASRESVSVFSIAAVGYFTGAL